MRHAFGLRDVQDQFLTGWIDRETGYYALIATEISSGGDRKGVELEQVMQDLIEDAIANRTPAP